MEGGQAVSLEEQLRKDAKSMREVGWFNRAKMYTAAADEIHRLEDRIKRLDETLEAVTDKIDTAWGIYMKFKEAK
jgi:archaellum component FlaC